LSIQQFINGDILDGERGVVGEEGMDEAVEVYLCLFSNILESWSICALIWSKGSNASILKNHLK
jgi:hypothetical protein